MPRHGVKTDEKSNEITAIPQLLEKLELNGCIVTIDAMGCQREIAQRITENGADYALAVKENQGQWPELKAAVRVVGHRATAAGDASQPRYCISSLAGSAEQLLAAIRGHRSIENSLHWTLDASFREDQRRVRKDHGPQNINTLRQIGHNLLKNERTLKAGIQGKRLNAGWDEDYLLKVLLG